MTSSSSRRQGKLVNCTLGRTGSPQDREAQLKDQIRSLEGTVSDGWLVLAAVQRVAMYACFSHYGGMAACVKIEIAWEQVKSRSGSNDLESLRGRLELSGSSEAESEPAANCRSPS